MIRRHQPSDMAQLMQLFDQAIQYHHELRPDAFKAPGRQARDFLKDLLKKSNVLCLVYEDQGQVLGYLISSTRPVWEHPLIPEQIMVQLEELYVLPSARRRGVATELMQALHEHALDISADVIELMVWYPNPEANAFYRSLGYVPRADILERRL